MKKLTNKWTRRGSVKFQVLSRAHLNYQCRTTLPTFVWCNVINVSLSTKRCLFGRRNIVLGRTLGYLVILTNKLSFERVEFRGAREHESQWRKKIFPRRFFSRLSRMTPSFIEEILLNRRHCFLRVRTYVHTCLLSFRDVPCSRRALFSRRRLNEEINRHATTSSSAFK